MLQFTASFARRAAAATTILGALLASCSSAGTPTANLGNDARSIANGYGAHASEPPARTGGWILPEAKRKRKLIYWGNYYLNTIAIYSAKGVNGKEYGEIKTGLSNPQRLFVDKQDNLYATNTGNSTITAYHRGETSPFLTISDGVDHPTGLTVDGAGTIYCANVDNTITVYPKGSTSPSLTISVYDPQWLATDAHDNLYASVPDGVEKWAPGTAKGNLLNLPAGSSALEVDKKGNFIVVYGYAVEYFPVGQNVPSQELYPAGTPFALSLSGNEKQLYVSVASGSQFFVENVAYPNGQTFNYKIVTSAGNWPLAASPDSSLGM